MSQINLLVDNRQYVCSFKVFSHYLSIYLCTFVSVRWLLFYSRKGHIPHTCCIRMKFGRTHRTIWQCLDQILCTCKGGPVLGSFYLHHPPVLRHTVDLMDRTVRYWLCVRFKKDILVKFFIVMLFVSMAPFWAAYSALLCLLRLDGVVVLRRFLPQLHFTRPPRFAAVNRPSRGGFCSAL